MLTLTEQIEQQALAPSGGACVRFDADPIADTNMYSIVSEYGVDIDDKTEYGRLLWNAYNRKFDVLTWGVSYTQAGIVVRATIRFKGKSNV